MGFYDKKKPRKNILRLEKISFPGMILGFCTDLKFF
jgi:hypothetical protein